MKSILSLPKVREYRVERLRQYEKQVYERGLKMNEVSGEYRAELIKINDKLILISVGSASLFLTFIGVLFSSTEKTSVLQFKYVIMAIVGFLLVVAFLLFARWFASMHLFATVHRFYILETIKKNNLELDIFEVDYAGYKAENDTDAIEHVQDLKTSIKEAKKAMRRDEKREAIYNRLTRVCLIAGYSTLVISYIFSMIFFIDVISMMNNR